MNPEESATQKAIEQFLALGRSGHFRVSFETIPRLYNQCDVSIQTEYADDWYKDQFLAAYRANQKEYIRMNTPDRNPNTASWSGVSVCSSNKNVVINTDASSGFFGLPKCNMEKNDDDKKDTPSGFGFSFPQSPDVSPETSTTSQSNSISTANDKPTTQLPTFRFEGPPMELIPADPIIYYSEDMFPKLTREQWKSVAQWQVLSEAEIEKYEDKVDWGYIGRYQRLSIDFMLKHSRKLDISDLIFNMNIDITTR